MNLDFRYANHSLFIRALQRIEMVLSLNYGKIGQTRPSLKVFNYIVGNSSRRTFFKLLFTPLHKLTQSIIGISFKIETLRYLSQKKL
jgi:hypothetical protein